MTSSSFCTLIIIHDEVGHLSLEFCKVPLEGLWFRPRYSQLLKQGQALAPIPARVQVYRPTWQITCSSMKMHMETFLWLAIRLEAELCCDKFHYWHMHGLREKSCTWETKASPEALLIIGGTQCCRYHNRHYDQLWQISIMGTPLSVTHGQTSNICHTLVGNKLHSDVSGASPVGAAPDTSSLLT